MRKIYLLFLMLMLPWVHNGQISYSYNWDSGSNTWEGTGGWSPGVSTAFKCSGTSSFRGNPYDTGATGHFYLRTPALSGTNGGNLSISFSYIAHEYGSPTDEVDIDAFSVAKVQWATTTSGPWFDGTDILQGTIGQGANCSTASAQIFGLPTSGTLYVRFYFSTSLDGGDYEIFIDDVNITQGPPPTCLVPTDGVLTALSATSVSFSWSAPSSAPANGYQYEVRTTTGAVVAQGTTPAGVLNASVSNLTAQTTYNLYVSSVCGGTDGESSWAQLLNFTTPCAAQVAPTVVETFTTYTGSITSTSLPCWQERTGATIGDPLTGTTSGWSNGYYNNDSANPNGNALYINLYGDDKEWMISPSIDLGSPTGPKYRLKYNALIIPWSGTNLVTSMPDDQSVTVLISTDNGITWSAVNTLMVYNNQNIPNANYNGGLPEVINLHNYSGTVKIAFFAKSTNTTGDFRFYIDNFVVEPIPDCAQINGVTVSNLTKNSAKISFTELYPVSVNGVHYEVRTSGEAGTLGAVQTGVLASGVNFVDLSALLPATTYQVYFRAACSATDWTVAKSFTTLCNYPDLISADDETRCGTGSVTFDVASSSGVVKWYNSANAFTSFYTGNSYTTPVLSQDTSYWISTESNSGGGFGGLVAPQNYASGTPSNNYGLYFNVLEGINLVSTDVYSTTAGTIGVKILNPDGVEILSISNIAITNGGLTTPNVISLNNIYLPPGNGYRLKIVSPTGVTLYRDNSGLTYPMVDPLNALNVTSGDWIGTTTSSYYYFYNIAYNKVCVSPRTEVIATVTPAPALTLSETDFEFCEGESVLVTVAEGASNYDSYVWEPATGVTGDATTGWTFNPIVSTVYTLTASQTTGGLCAQIIDVDFTVNPLPDYTPLVESATTCIDMPFELNPNISGKDEFIVGTATTLTGDWDSTTAFNNRYSGSRQQYIFTKSELNALGFDAGNITGISFEIATLGSANSNSNYTIKMKHVSQENFSTTSFLTGTFTTVFGQVSYTHQPSGWHDFEFTTPFVWDGSSNILIELTHGGANSNNNAQTYYTETTDDKSLAANSVTATTGTLSKKRLNTKFLVNGQGETVWTPETNLYLDLAATQPYVGGNAKKVYFKSSTEGVYNYSVILTPPNQCIVNLTTTISVIDVTEPIVTNQSICSTEVSTITVTGLQTGGTVKWYETETSTEELDEIPATGTYFVEQVVGTCKSARVSAVITLNLQLPAPVAPLDQKFCLDTVNTSYTVADLDATATTGTIDWFLNEDDTTPLAITDVLATGTYYVAESNGTCWSSKTEVEVTIGTMPAVPNGASQAFCSSLTLGDVEVGQVPGATVNWYATADATETLDTESVLTDATYYVSQIIGFCESERVAIQIQLIPVFDAPIAPSPVLYCQQTTFDDLEVTLLPGGTKGWFTSIATAEPNIQLTDIVTTGTYYVAQYNGACWSNKTPVVVTVNPTPAALNNVTQTLCGTFTLADAQLGQVANATVKFYSSETSDVVLPMTTPLVTGTYYVSQTLGGCESARVTVEFTVYEILVAPQAPAVQFYCGTTTFADLDATPTTGVIGWFATENATTPLSNTATVSTGVYYVAQLNGACWSPKIQVTVSVNPIPASLNNTPQQLCGTFTLADAELDQSENGVVLFYSSATSEDVLPSTTPLLTGTYYVSQIVLGCESPRVAVNFVVNEILVAPQAPATQSFCGPTVISNLSATPTTGTIGWFTTEDGTTPLGANASVASGTYYVAQLNGQCWSPRTMVEVTVNPIPAILDATPQQLCGTFTLADAVLGQAGNAVVKFYASLTSSTVLPLTNSLVTGTYYVSQTVGGCESSRVAVSFVVNEILTAPQAPSSQLYCGATTFADLSATPTTGIIGWFNSVNATAPMASTASVVTGTYYVAQLNGQCWSPRTTVNVTVNPKPAAPSNATIHLCGNYNFGQVSIGQVSGATIKWYASETSITPINLGTNVVGGSYYVSQTVGGCESDRVMVTIFQTDALSNPTAASQTFCGSATVADLVAQGTNGSIVWYNSSVALNPLSPNAALTTGTYYAAQTLNGCFSNRVPISVFVVSIAAPNVDTFNFCGSATVADLVLPTPTGVVYKWFNSPSNPVQLDANTALVTGTYFVSRSQYGCESLRTPVIVNINSVPDAPTGVSPQVFIQGSTINDIVMNQPNVVWYMTQQDARNGVNPLVQGMPLVNGTTYYGVIIGTNGCPSLPFALTVDVYLSDDKFVKEELKYYPNPVEDILTVSYSDRILLIEVFDLLGKRVKVKSTDDKEVNIDLSDLASGTYMIQLKTENKSQFLKIIKK